MLSDHINPDSSFLDVFVCRDYKELFYGEIKFLILCYEGNGYIKKSFFATFLIIPTRPSAY
ncbi:unnamed protein product, partial [Vitis vinifera]